MNWIRRSFVPLIGITIVFSGCESPRFPATPSPSNPPAEAPGLIVEVTVTGFENQTGKCRVAAYDAVANFQKPDKAVARAVVAIDGKSMVWTFPWKGGSLAISAYHDQNENGQLDRNLIGIPTEHYGFSNNPKRGYGPPKFEQVVLAPPEEASQDTPWRIEITIQ